MLALLARRDLLENVYHIDFGRTDAYLPFNILQQPYARDPQHIAKTTPLKVVSQPEDIAESALFLGSRAARHITGETLLVDAGMHLVGT